LLVAAPVLAFAGILWHLDETTWEKRQTQAALAKAEHNLYLNHIALAARELSAHHVDRAERFLDQCPARLRTWEWHYLKRQCHQELWTLPKVGGFGVAFSPDGKQLASASIHDQTVKVVDLATGKVRFSYPRAGPGVAFSPDGTQLASSSLH